MIPSPLSETSIIKRTEWTLLVNQNIDFLACIALTVADVQLVTFAGNNRLMKLVHELDVPGYETMNERDPMCPALWRYRKKITIEHLSSKFQEYSQGCNQQDKCDVLAEFLKKVLTLI